MGKTSSDRKINYNLRPSKSIERKMILEVLKEICSPKLASDYRYVGFGSSFFTDFKLFHKGLNISDMVSIEAKGSSEKRVRFNKPYSCIDLRIGRSTDVLPKLKWNKKNIVWLDYETGLQRYMFDDITTCTLNFKPGSILILTLRREFDQQTRQEFEKEFGNISPVDLKSEDLEAINSAVTIQKMFTNHITDGLRDAYAAYSDPTQKVVFKPLFNFTYKDEARMYTFGGMFISQDQIESVNTFHFNSLEFVGKNVPYDISFPIITNKEYHELNRLLPQERSTFLAHTDIDFIPKEHKESYYNTYKFYPSYIEISDM